MEKNGKTIMKTKYKFFINEPTAIEINSLIGDEFYKYYCTLDNAICLYYKPELEIWDNAGRRGKYFHGYRSEVKSFFLDIYLSSSEKGGQVKCDLTLKDASFNKIVKIKESFSKNTQTSIESAQRIREEYDSSNVDFFIDQDTLLDVIKIVELLSE
ncbi:hypothetical protein ULVI_09110 [Cochleicola gelatinilyticus]|uniref:Uncharacterized protein n=2 Tax=Cochleicola gelatinilyticus TaxID=1763537 RepID=A0A167HL77_9FLAO|nr:hypothetical protein ULVI_09110 [Cochleicola gelatinilyticus]